MAFPFPGCDPATLLAFLASLSEGEQPVLLDDDSDEESGQTLPLSTQEGMVQRFKMMRARFVRPGGIVGEQMFAGNLCTSSMTLDGAKPTSELRSLQELKPMIGKELELGTTHRGRYLCGWVAVDDAFFGIASSSLILEDVTGYLVEIAAYGLVDTELRPHERQRVVAGKFPKGRPIVVLEPYYKVRMDGSMGVRVDQAEEIIPWRDVPTDLMSWKTLGNEFFSMMNSQYEGALACYRRALNAVQSEVRMLAVLLTNIAACRVKTEDYVISIQLSGAAVHLDPTYFKGWYRLASALAKVEGDEYSDLLPERVVAQARKALPNLSLQEEKLLQNTLDDSTSHHTKHSQFCSYAEWCLKVADAGLLLTGGEKSGEAKTADEWRKEGSDYFAKGDYESAEKSYRNGVAAMTSCCQNVSVVLNNVAAVHLTLHRDSSAEADEIPSIEAAVLICTVAGIVDPLNHKAWLRRARCLETMGFSQEICVQDLYGIRANVVLNVVEPMKSSDQLKVFRRSLDAGIQKLIRSKSTEKESKSSREVQTEQHEEDLPCDVPAVEDYESIDQYIACLEGFVGRTRLAHAISKSQSNPRLQLLPLEMQMFFAHPPPGIHTEYPKLRGWPGGINTTLAQKLLYRAFLDASVNPWIDALRMRDGSFFRSLSCDDKIKRWHGAGAMEQLQAKNHGDITDARETLSDYVPSYHAKTRSNFSNNVSRADIYYFDSTHVAIGFNDFSSLLAATLCKNSSRDEPLRYVGFEMSEFAVAKCKVVAYMLGCPSVSISSIMEVWLSSTWSATALKDFRDSLNVVLASLQEQEENPKVLSYLKHWASVEAISATEARSQFFSNLHKHSSRILPALCCFRRQIDRLDLTQYMLSGEIQASSDVANLVEKEQPGATKTTTGSTKQSKKKRNRKKKSTKGTTAKPTSSAPLVGNLTMWNVPVGSPPLDDEIALNTVDFTNLVEDYVAREKKQKNSTKGLSVVDLFIIHILKNLHRLRGLILANQLAIEVNYGVVKAVRGDAVNDPVNQELLVRIAEMRPETISWSNLPDYFLLEDFHDLARRCSIYGDCMHYGYSTNWPAQVYGASIIDYDPKRARVMIDAVLNSALGFSSEHLPVPPLPSMVDILTKENLDKLLFLPFREPPLDATAYVLAQMYNDDWIEHFVKKGESMTWASRFNCGFQMGTNNLAVKSPLYRSPCTLYMGWCYDPHVRLIEKDPFESNAIRHLEMLARSMVMNVGG
ncbi:hypothetical protein F443_06959 [Phytophthora nicotianae P1569]|uniref:Uncharacterized protein n=1 Tax=Phytophthora nicotianae P1569 TaxID=1317065 RepID=V9FCE8_PHYNI|nr:hypothetical protein F443_06959 [Phytophthora nicotianae P1569]